MGVVLIKIIEIATAGTHNKSNVWLHYISRSHCMRYLTVYD